MTATLHYEVTSIVTVLLQ